MIATYAQLGLENKCLVKQGPRPKTSVAVRACYRSSENDLSTGSRDPAVASGHDEVLRSRADSEGTLSVQETSLEDFPRCRQYTSLTVEQAR